MYSSSHSLVPPLGIEPSCSGFQPVALTTVASTAWGLFYVLTVTLAILNPSQVGSFTLIFCPPNHRSLNRSVVIIRLGDRFVKRNFASNKKSSGLIPFPSYVVSFSPGDSLFLPLLRDSMRNIIFL